MAVWDLELQRQKQAMEMAYHQRLALGAWPRALCDACGALFCFSFLLFFSRERRKGPRPESPRTGASFQPEGT